MRRFPAHRAVAAFDSASTMLAATAAALEGEALPHLGQGRLAAAQARASRLVPVRARRAFYGLAGGISAVRPDRLGDLDTEEVAAWVVAQYDGHSGGAPAGGDADGRYPAVAIGASNGAAVHLWAALGIPWLPQTVLVPVRHSQRDVDDAHAVCEAGARLAEPLLAANSTTAVHHMHDPNQDRLMVRWMTYLRLKRLALGATYERFLGDRLQPGGTVVLVNDRSTWPVTRIGERHVFQFGGYGGATVQEYQGGGPRVQDFLQRHGSVRTAWNPPAPDDVAPEAEWGLHPDLGEDVRRWAGAHGHPVHELAFDGPEELSGPVADLHRQWYAQRGLPADRLLVESFAMLDPVAALRSARVPYWTAFPVQDSVARLGRYLQAGPAYRDVAVMLFANGVRSIGQAGPQQWLDLVPSEQGHAHLLGTDAKRFPKDFAAFGSYGPAQRRDGPRWTLPEEHLPLSALFDLA